MGTVGAGDVVEAADNAQARVLDLFAGSGALGLEALSRGASSGLACGSIGAVAQVMTQESGASSERTGRALMSSRLWQR